MRPSFDEMHALSASHAPETVAREHYRQYERWLAAQPLTTAALTALLTYRMGRPPVVVEGDAGRPLRRIAWCTGGAQGYFESAIAAGADAFITGEISEPQAHLARETGVTFVACGHHASERFGAPALGAHLAEKFGLEHQFIEIENPA